MNGEQVELTSHGIQKILNRYTPEKSIAEYIWNGFDANANEVAINIKYSNNDFGHADEISISDNGEGICFESLDEKFKVFYDSAKRNKKKKKSDLIRGKNGYGRLTFFKFARFASWSTYYNLGDNLFSYNIDIESDNLKQFVPSPKQDVSSGSCGTTVTFKDINTNINRIYVKEKIIPYLKAEFAWLLEVKPDSRILINGEELDYKSLIGEKEERVFEVFDSNHTKKTFDAIFIQWNKMKTDEYSKFYFLNSKYQIRFSKTTRLNNKGDKFYHSLIIANDFFDDVSILEEDEPESNNLFEEDGNNKLLGCPVLCSNFNSLV